MIARPGAGARPKLTPKSLTGGGGRRGGIPVSIPRNGRRRGGRGHTCVILGSFRKDQNYQKIVEAGEGFEASRCIKVVWPPLSQIRDQGSQFPRFLTDSPRASDKELEQELLERHLQACCFVYLVNQYYDNQPYIGLDTAFEIGYACKAGKPVFPLHDIVGSPVIGSQVEGVKTPDQIVRMVQDGRCPCGGRVRKAKQAAPL